MNTEFKEIKIAEDTKFEKRDFVGYDFTKSDLTEVIFENCNFSNCVFNKTILNHTRFWCCFFDSCKSANTNLATTYLGAWGGGFSNCAFEKCKFGGIIDGSYFVDCTFSKCKIKTTHFRTYLMKNIRFDGLVDDLFFQKFINKEIYEYQTAEIGKKIENRIRKVVGQAFDSEKVMLENVDFSECRIQFLSFENCETGTIIVPDDSKYLLIRNIDPVARKVYADIEKNWTDENNKTWALRCVEDYFNRTTEIVSFYEFKHFENEEFAEQLMCLFTKYQDQ